MYRSLDKADRPSLQESAAPHTIGVRDAGRSAPSNLSGIMLWLYVGLILATLAALMIPPVLRWLERLGGAL